MRDGSPLAFPFGVAPGFDPTHIGNKSGACRLSSIASGDQHIDLMTGAVATNATNGGSISSYIGPNTNYANNTASTFSGKPASVDSVCTFACIMTCGGGYYFENNNAPSVGVQFGNLNGSEGGAVIIDGTRFDCVVSPVLTSGAPYFLATSVSLVAGTYTIICVAINLSNGAVSQKTATFSGSAPTASSGTYTVGSGGGGPLFYVGGMAAAMFNNKVALSLPEMLSWAADPWSFWYPQKDESWAGSAAAAFRAFWASNNMPVIGTGNY